MATLRTNYQSLTNMQEDLREAENGESMSAHTSPYLATKPIESPGTDNLSIVLIGPDERRREAVTVALSRCAGNEVRAFTSYPPSLDDVPRLLEQHHDVIIIDLDSDPEYALELVESIGSNGTATVMVYSAKADPDLLVRCMRAGAREFLTLPLELDVVGESLVRAAARKPVVRTTTVQRKKVNGKLLAFMGSKGGAGVTTLATNFAVALAQHPSQKTLLIDLDLPLGDAALNLGIISEYSTINALQALDRLDGTFLAGLLMEHSSGLKVLAAPGRYVQYQATDAAIDKLLAVARQEFDNVVIDLGSKVDLTGTLLFKEATSIYLVTQAGIPELRNSNRLISQVFGSGGPNLEIVINRYETRALSVSEEHITKALTRPAQWKIPNDYASVRRMQVNASPLVLTDSAVSRQILLMAGAVTGEVAAKPKKKVFNLFG
jgi:pilus assembly protein CpaE